jgi:hypothetical protein
MYEADSDGPPQSTARRDETRQTRAVSLLEPVKYQRERENTAGLGSLHGHQCPISFAQIAHGTVRARSGVRATTRSPDAAAGADRAGGRESGWRQRGTRVPVGPQFGGR